jgi:hypothetical protein
MGSCIRTRNDSDRFDLGGDILSECEVTERSVVLLDISSHWTHTKHPPTYRGLT